MDKLFTVYRSSAGSGKTETLVVQYLKLALSNVSPLYFSRILAITFTNKAAEEMRARILSRLKSVATKTDARTLEIIEELQQHTGQDEKTIRLRAEEVLTQILHNYHRFHVSTIDRFIYSVIRAFSTELGVQPDAEIISDSEKVLSVSVNQLLEQVGINQSYTSLLTDFMLWRQEEGAAWNPEAELMEFGKQIFEEDSRVPLQELSGLTLQDFIDIKNKLNVKVRAFESEVRALAKRGLDCCHEHGLTKDDFYKKSQNGLYVFFEKILNEKFASPSIPDPVTSFISGEQRFHTSLKGERLKQAQLAETELVDIASALEKKYSTQFNVYRFNSEVSQRMYSLSLLAGISAFRFEYLDERGAVLLSDFHRIVAEIVCNEPAPFIYERTGERFAHFFIDEFQDTSQLQWGNLLPLLENGLATGNNSLVVGDAKQSIYRWRNGKVEQFIELPKLVDFEGQLWSEREQALIRNYHQEILGFNRRSAHDIIQFNNSLFNALSVYLYSNDQPTEYSKVYQGELLEQKSPPGAKSGFVKVDLPDYTDEGEKPGRDEKQFRALEIMMGNISRCLQQGYLEKDICVLVRTNDEGDKVSRFLTEKNIRVASGNALLLKNFQEVRILINGMRALLAPRNESDKGLFMLEYLQWNKHADPIQALREFTYAAEGKRYYLFYDFLKKYKLEISPVEIRNMTFYELMLRFSGLLKLDTRHVAIAQLLEAVHANKPGVYFESSEWFQWWDSVSEKLTAEAAGGDDAITVMTIHKAKGLEFPVVFVPFCNWTIDKTKKTEWIKTTGKVENLPWAVVKNNKDIWKDSEYEWIYTREDLRKRFDHMNMLYVAFTRARERLYIVSSPKQNSVHAWLSKTIPALPGMKNEGFGWCTGKETEVVEPGIAKKLSEERNSIKEEFIHWTEKLRVAFTAPDNLVEANEREGARASGIRMHDVLRHVLSLPVSENEINLLLIKCGVPADLQPMLKEQMLRIISHTDFVNLHTGSYVVYNEREWVDAQGRSIRPDRVVITGESCMVVDYKTGLPDKAHEKQIRQYAEVLSNWGYSQPQAYLFYLSEMRLTRVI